MHPLTIVQQKKGKNHHHASRHFLKSFGKQVLTTLYGSYSVQMRIM